METQDESYWKDKLTPDQYHILREKATESAFSGEYYLNHDTGMYHCGGCGVSLFSSDAKYDSGCGWPSFDRPVNDENIELREDDSLGMKRTEVVCKNCGGHLGHVFDDGPKETTGQRYCINSGALNFKKKNSNAGVPARGK